jgi:YidC/Oxa1 family membrane protein insertase
VQQKMMATPSADPQQQAMSESMSLTMPLMFGLITFQLASGLALYFVATNVFGIVQQYFVSGWGGLAPMLGRVRSSEKRNPSKGKRHERKD